MLKNDSTARVDPATSSSAELPTDGAPKRAFTLGQVASRYVMIIVLIALVIYAQRLNSGFFEIANLSNMVSAVVPVGIIALGMTYVMIGGGFDLSVAAIYAGASVVYATLADKLPLPWAFAITVLVGIAAGVVNGLIITVLKVNPFIATLSTASLFAGATYLYTNNLPVLVENPNFGDLGTGQWNGVWYTVYILIALIIVAGIALSRTVYGRSVYAIGGNDEAARLAGLRVDFIRTSTYAITGASAAIAGMITASQISIGQPGIGVEVTLNSIAIVIIGGTSLRGGEGSIWRTVIGLSIWAIITNIFATQALTTGARLMTVGFIVLGAVALDSLAQRYRR